MLILKIKGNRLDLSDIKPEAQRHAKRLDQKRKHAKPEFDPADTDRWLDCNGKFTIPPSKGN